MTRPQVLISGAGPAGMVLALWLHEFNVPFRIIDKAPAPGLASRATIVQTRTLEIYRQLGIADRIIAAGNKWDTMNITKAGALQSQLRLGDMGKGLSHYPFALILPQDAHEHVLSDVLTEKGIKVERRVELIDAVQSRESIDITLRDLVSAKEENLTVKYLAGCDGAHSFVRKVAEAKMEGGTYGKRFYVADVHLDSNSTRPASGTANMNLSSSDFCMMLPFKAQGDVRLVGYVPDSIKDKDDITFDDIEPIASKVTQLKFNGAAWFSVYHLHHRVASRFQNGRVFLCGDACHLHSPTGGQGMNAGIGDSSNLAWKLASVLQGSAPEALLDTYEPERRGFAKTIVGTTDTVFNYISGSTWQGWIFRTFVLGYLVAFLMRFAYFRKNFFLALSQTKTAYPQSSLSVNAVSSKRGTVLAGNRLPLVAIDDDREDNHATLTNHSWQVHVYGSMEPKTTAFLEDSGVPFNVFSWSGRAADAGLVQDMIYVVRPDGHIGWKGLKNDELGLRQYVSRWGIAKTV